MKFQSFGSVEKTAARAKRLPPVDDAPASDGAAKAADEAALRLERELAVVLSRKPQHHTLYTAPCTGEDDGETPLIHASEGNAAAYGERTRSAGTVSSNGLSPASAETLTPPADCNTQHISATSSEPGTQERWMKSTRIHRRSALFRKSASVAVTFTVTTFIVLMVAVILFGLPNGARKFTAAGDRAALIKTRTVGTVPVQANTSTGRMRLGLK